MMLDQMNVDFMRARLHGSNSSLKFLEEDDSDLKMLLLLSSGFMISRQRDVANGGYVNKLTARLATQIEVAAFQRAAVIDLIMNGVTTRYRLDAKAEAPTPSGSIYGYADCTMMKNERTEIV